MKIMNTYLEQYHMDSKKINKFDSAYACVMLFVLVTLLFYFSSHFKHNLYGDLDKLDFKSFILSTLILLFLLISLSSYNRLRNFYLKKNNIELRDIDGSDILFYDGYYVLDHWDIGSISLGSDNIDIKDLDIDKVYYIIFGKNKYEIDEKIYYNLFSLTPYSNLLGITAVDLYSYKKIK